MNNTVYDNLLEPERLKIAMLLDIGWQYKKKTLGISEIEIELYYKETDASFSRRYPAYGFVSDNTTEEAKELTNLLGELPEYYFHALEELNESKKKHENTLYCFVREDLENALNNQDNYYPVKAIIEKGFSAVEDFQLFVCYAEDSLIEKENEHEN